MKSHDYYDQQWLAMNDSQDVDVTATQRMSRLRDALHPLLRSREPGDIWVLDASCGKGTFIRFLRSLGIHVVGMDIALPALREARNAKGCREFVAASAESPLPFPDSTFNAVWFGETLAHLFDGHFALSEFNRVLKPGGLLILTTPYHGLVKNLAIVLFSFDEHFYPDNYRIRFYDRVGLERSLKRAGFKPEVWKGVGRAWPMWKSFFVAARKSGKPHPLASRHPPSDPRHREAERRIANNR